MARTKKTNLTDIYKALPPDLKKEVGSSVTYTKMMSAWHQYVMNYLIYTGKSLSLPEFAGEILFTRRKTPSVLDHTIGRHRVNFGHHIKTGEAPPIYTNKHSGGYYAKVK